MLCIYSQETFTRRRFVGVLIVYPLRYLGASAHYGRDRTPPRCSTITMPMLFLILSLYSIGIGSVVAGVLGGAPTHGFNFSSVYSNRTNATYYNYTNAISSNDFSYRGVALGGWLVLEPYITPSLFLSFNESSHNLSDIPKDEYRFCEKLGEEEASKRLQKHWSTFYNALDFADIKAYGFNMVRIPVGYWAFETLDDDPYVPGAQEYLDKAIEWAHDNDLKVWIDLHGAPNSQNGFDNSGLFRKNEPGWQDKSEYVDLTLKVLRQIYAKYGSAEFSERYNDTILGIEVLNEPMGPKLKMPKLKDFYDKAYTAARSMQETNNTIVFHDAFQKAGYWNNFRQHNNNMTNITRNYNILIDHHHYEVFGVGQLNSSIAQHIENIKNYASGIEDELNHHPAVVGEWSAALTDCAPWLNSVNWGTRWEGTPPYDNSPIKLKSIKNCHEINNWKSWSEKHKRDTRKFIEIQLDQYESKTNGWIFWCYKTETTIEWDFKRLAQYGLFPQPFEDRQYIKNGTDTKPDKSGSSRQFGLLTLSLFVAIFLSFFI